MKNRYVYLLLLLLPSIVFVLVLAFFMRGRYEPQSKQVQETKVELLQMTAGDTPVFVKLALTDAQQAQGLSGVTSLQENEGMYFVFPQKRNTAFWMKDMNIAIDMIWISDNKIIQIDQKVQPPAEGTPDNKLKLYVPKALVDAVLEVNAGFSQAHGISVGDTVTPPEY